MCRVLVTGKGLLGTAIDKVDRDFHDYDFIYPNKLTWDLTQPKKVNLMLEAYKPDVIIHTAAKVGGIKLNSECPADMFYENMIMTSNVIQMAAQFGVKKVIAFGSTCAIDESCAWKAMDQFRPWIVEEITQDGEPYKTNYGYGYAKRMVEIHLRAACEQYGMKYAYYVPVTMYGPCFSGDTDVMTPDGIRNIKDLKVGDSIFTLNDKHCVEISLVVGTQKYKSSGFYNFRGKSVDFRVTPDHKMYFKIGKGKFQKRYAEWFETKCGKKTGQIALASHNFDLGWHQDEFNLEKYVDEFHLVSDGTIRDHKHSHSKKYKTVYRMIDFASLVGWFVSEGSIGTVVSKNGSQPSCQITISQDKKSNRQNWNKIFNLLERMHIPFSHGENGFTFTSRMFKNFFEKECGVNSELKKLPKFIFSSSKEIRNVVFEALMWGDGNKDGRRYTTKSKQLKDDFIFLCFTLGIKTGKVYLENNCWKINIRKTTPCVKYKNIYREESESQDVYCVTTSENNIIYAGRNHCFNWVGQCDNFNLDDAHVIPSLVHKCYRSMESGEPVRVWGDGTPRRELLFSEDLASIILTLLRDDTETMIVGSGEEVPISGMVTAIAECMGFDGEIVYETDKPKGQLTRPMASQTKLRKFMKEFTFTPFKDGIAKTVEWFKNNYPNVRI